MLKAIRNAVIKSIILTVVIGALAFIAGHLSVPSLDVAPAEGGEPVKGSAAYIVQKHDCWTGSAPLNADGSQVFPGHVVLRDGAGYRYAGHKATDWALNNLGDDSIVAFCR